MTPEQLLARMRLDEDTLTERKTQPHQGEVVPALVAFANSVVWDQEAVLFLGVKPDGTPVGVDNADALGQKVAQWAREQCYPPVRVECVTIPGLAERDVLAVVVRVAERRPHFAGWAYRRDGPRTVKVPPEQFDELLALRNTQTAMLLRHKGQTVSLQTIHHELGRLDQNDPLLTARYECELVGCDPFAVVLRELASGTTLAIELERVSLLQDTKWRTPLLLRVRRG